MGKRLELTGQRFGRLVVEWDCGTNSERKSIWSCVCDCGKKTIVRGSSLRKGETLSCGCLQEELRGRWHVHGERGSKLYKRWTDMKTRCNNPNGKDYSDYGGRGITVCERWNSFENFAEDMGATFKPDLWLDRIDNNKGYSPENCKWRTCKEQNRNRRDNILIEWDGETLTASAWEERLGIRRSNISGRLRVGWSIQEALGFVERRRTS